VRDTGRNEDARARRRVEGLVADAELELALEDVPGLFEPLVHVQAGVEARRRRELDAARSLGVDAAYLETHFGAAKRHRPPLTRREQDF
jgi:hypothetical protein